jgi:hypothetical protein
MVFSLITIPRASGVVVVSGAMRDGSVKRAALVAVAIGLSACGGGTPGPARTAETKGGTESKTAGGEEAASKSAEPAGPRKPSCADGTCFECGEGICPSGFYCETGKAGKPACAWAAGCAEKPTCSCLAPFVKGCRCEEANGGPRVSCGG